MELLGCSSLWPSVVKIFKIISFLCFGWLVCVVLAVRAATCGFSFRGCYSSSSLCVFP